MSDAVGSQTPHSAVASQTVPTSFTCRARTMRDLTPAQAALAHLGQISPELKANSPVYYWQKTRQHRSRQEAICKKNAKWHITTFGSHGHFAADAAFKCKQAAPLSVVPLRYRVKP